MWPAVRVVVVDSPSDIHSLRGKCRHSEQLVSIKSADHVIWLDTQVKSELGNTATSQGKGIPLGYDYSQSNQYYDLNNQDRSVQYIFDELRKDYGWGGDYQTDQTSDLQYYAGLGWWNNAIVDWANKHPTYAVICEAKLRGRYLMPIITLWKPNWLFKYMIAELFI